MVSYWYFRAPAVLAALCVGTPAWAAPGLVALTPLTDTFSPAATVEYDVEFDLALEDVEVLQLTLPGGIFEATRTDLVHQVHGVYWQGKIYDSWEVLITVYDETASGLIHTPWQVYELIPGPKGGLRLAELDDERFLPCAADELEAPIPEESGSAAPGGGGANQAGGSTNGTLTIMDVMVVYTAVARSRAGGQSQIESVIQSAVNITNTAYENSEVDARIHLIHTAETSIPETGSASSVLSTLRDDSTVQGLRNTYGADMVALIVDDLNNACGIGYLQRRPGPGFAPSAYQVTDRGCAVGNRTFAHEFGHNQGCEHDPANGNSPSRASFPFAFGHFHSGSYRTVMSYSNQCSGGCPRVSHFSNSNVLNSNRATGILDQRENYRTINATAPIVADFRAPAVTLDVAQATYQTSERDSSVSIDVERSGRADIAVTVVVNTESQTAQAGSDFVDTAVTLTWPAGDTTPRTVTIPLLDDRRIEGLESFDVVLSDARGAGFGTTVRARVDISDFEEGRLRIVGASTEVREDRGQVVLEVERTDGSDGEVSVAAAATPNTAALGADFSGPSGRLQWSDGDSAARQLVLPIIDDRLVEGDETFTVTLVDPEGGGIPSASSIEVTIVDWEEGSVSLSEPVFEVREDAGQVVLQLARDNGADGEVTVDLAYTEGTPRAQAGQDYDDSALTVTFSAGESGPRTVVVPILDDVEVEGDEQFVVGLVRPTNGVIVGELDEATVVIRDWEEGALAFDRLSIGTTEDAGSITVAVVRLNGSDGEVSVRAATEGDSATADVDFRSQSEVLRWSDGDITPRSVTVELIDDAEIEDLERFFVQLSEPVEGRLAEPAQISVNVEDAEPGRVVLSSTQVEAREDSAQVVLQAQRVDGRSGRVTVDYRLVANTAEAGADYDDASGTLTFSDREAGPFEITVSLNDDLVAEPPETFELQLLNPTGGVLVGEPAVITLLDAGAGQVASTEEAYSVSEGTGQVTIDIERRGETVGPLVVSYETVPGSAVSPNDFVEAAGQLEWADGEAGVRSVVVTVNDDGDDEPDESFELRLASDNDTVELTTAARVTVLDNDEADAGCGCATAERRSSPMLAWGLLCLLALVRRRR